MLTENFQYLDVFLKKQVITNLEGGKKNRLIPHAKNERSKLQEF